MSDHILCWAAMAIGLALVEGRNVRNVKALDDALWGMCSAGPGLRQRSRNGPGAVLGTTSPHFAVAMDQSGCLQKRQGLRAGTFW